MTHYVQEPELCIRDVQGEALIVSCATNSLHRLDSVGGIIFRHLRKPATVEQLVTAVSQKLDTSDVTEEEIADDISSFLEALLTLHLIRPTTASPRPKTSLRLDDWRAEMEAAGEALLIPIWAKIEVTTRCNLHCIHCYIPRNKRHTSIESRSLKNEAELTTEELVGCFAQLAELGTILLTFTGGEIFLRDDIFDLLSFAHEHGFIIELLTSATTLSADDIAALSGLNIGRVQVSIYSHDENRHDSITGITGSFRRTIKAAQLMVDSGLNVEIASTLMLPNYKDAAEMSHLASSIGATFSLGYPVTSRIDGSTRTQKLRLGSEELREAMRSVPDLFQMPSPRAPTERICPAGINMCSVSATGQLFPCSQFLLQLGSIREHSIQDIWTNSSVLATIRQHRMQDLKATASGYAGPFIGLCPGLNLLEEGDYLRPASITELTTRTVVRQLQKPTDK